MKTFQSAFCAFAILTGVYGLPSSDVSIKSSLSKRDLPFNVEDYEYCLDNDFKDSFNDITPWGGVQCTNNKQIMFYAKQVTSGWASGADCYKYAKEGLRENIKGGNALATKEVCANWFACCELGVKTMPYPVHEYVDCLQNEARNSMFEKSKWADVICPNPKIKFVINGNFWRSPKDCYQAVAQELEEKIYNGDPHAFQTTEYRLASCTIAVRTEF